MKTSQDMRKQMHKPDIGTNQMRWRSPGKSTSNCCRRDLQPKNQHLFSIIDDSSGQDLGMIWLEIKPEGRNPSAFIYDFVINKEFRGRGIGKQALLAAENVLRSLGVKTVSLHVFNDNTAAKKLYEKVGFEISSYNMRKKL